MKSRFKYIGVDPGVGGGMAVISETGRIKAYKCPSTSDEMALLFQISIGETAPENVKFLMERVWARPANAVRAAFTYGVNYGQWLGIASSHEIEVNTVLPLQWMKAVGCPKSLKKNIRKNWLKDKARKLYPKINKLTLATSDAILITYYARKEHFNDKEKSNISKTK